ncbi:hypothetical protein GH714_008469 [Hevea brasiliensis]|uniref:Retrotransposon gag domain-containing protein n=1 Tax=Hevea brasiliensis TaxID=3981 RepID=A0A6A6K3U8_HEVBR|nr:hypothetical protein GH714_008469 [Hevea brasiliensis]
MPNTRMDSRVDAIERSLGALEEGLVEWQENGSRMRERIRGDSSLPLQYAHPGQTSSQRNQVPLVVTDDSQVTAKKVELPNFDGQDPVGGWLELTNISQLIEPAWNESSFGSGLYVELLQRFGGDAFASPYERLAAVRQDGSVDDFIDEFVARAAQVPGITDQFYIGFFLNGLKAEIRVRIRSQDTGDIFRLMTLAREVERELLHTGMTR